MSGKHENEKMIGMWLDKAIFEQFEKQLAIDGINKSDLLKTAVYGYLYGDYTLTKNDRQIHCSVEVE